MKTKLLLQFSALLILFILPGICYAQEPAGEVKPDILDSMLSIAIILFILSVITEKIVQFIRKYSSAVPEKLRVSGVWENINSKDKAKEKDVEKEVMSLSIVVGIIVCLLFKVDLICMIQSADPRLTLYWTSEHDCNTKLFFTFLGIFISGFFLSFGSKFFHDLVDMLLQVKNLKRKMNEKETYEIEKIEDLDEWLKQTDNEVINLVIKENEEAIKSIPGIISYGRGYFKEKNLKRLCIQMQVENELSAAKVPIAYSYKLSTGKRITVPVKVYITGVPKVSAVQAGMGIANKTKALGWGTIGCIVKDVMTKEKYILTCLHVLKGNTNWKSLDGEKQIIYNLNGEEKNIGSLVAGYRTETLDAAIASCITDADNNGIGDPKEIRDININDALKETGVRLKGFTTGHEVEGIIFHECWSTKFGYPDGHPWKLNDLIQLTRQEGGQYKSLTLPGDSGAIVIDSGNKVIGMVVGGDNFFTYAIKIERIFNAFDIELP